MRLYAAIFGGRYRRGTHAVTNRLPVCASVRCPASSPHRQQLLGPSPAPSTGPSNPLWPLQDLNGAGRVVVPVNESNILTVRLQKKYPFAPDVKCHEVCALSQGLRPPFRCPHAVPPPFFCPHACVLLHQPPR